MENEELKKQIEGLNTKVDTLQKTLNWIIEGLTGAQCLRFKKVIKNPLGEEQHPYKQE